MNRCVLLIICDFLLLSLLSLADFSGAAQSPTAQPPAPVERTAMAEISFDEDMVRLLEAALAAEEESRTSLDEELAAEAEARRAAEESLAAREAELAEQQRQLREMEEAVARQEATLDETTAELAQRREEAERLAREAAEVRERFAAAEAERRALERERALLSEQLADVREMGESERETARRIEQELQQVRSRLDQRESELEQRRLAEEQARETLRETQTRLEVVAERATSLEENLRETRQRVEEERTIRERTEARTDVLVAEVSELARTSGEIREQVERLRPITTNEVFTLYEQRRVNIRMRLTRQVLIGSGEREYVAPALLLAEEDGDRVFALFHASRTPLRAEEFVSPMPQSITATIEVGDRRINLTSIGRLAGAPDILLVAMNRQSLKNLGLQPFSLSSDPLRFEQLVVVRPEGDRYGETTFRLTSIESAEIQLNNRITNRLFGEFSPAAGDFVFDRTGGFLGVVTRPDRGFLVRNIAVRDLLTVGDQFDARNTLRLLREP